MFTDLNTRVQSKMKNDLEIKIFQGSQKNYQLKFPNIC